MPPGRPKSTPWSGPATKHGNDPGSKLGKTLPVARPSGRRQGRLSTKVLAWLPRADPPRNAHATIAPYLSPALLGTFETRHRGVEITVHEDVTRNLIAAVIAGELDLAVMAGPIEEERVAQAPRDERHSDFQEETMDDTVWSKKSA